MSKELSAKEAWDNFQDTPIEADNNFDAMYDASHIAFAEHYATARLEAYKAELVGIKVKIREAADQYALSCWNPSDKPNEFDNAREDFIVGAMHILSHLTDTPEYTEAEQNCEGCMGPCGQCETKKEQ